LLLLIAANITGYGVDGQMINTNKQHLKAKSRFIKEYGFRGMLIKHWGGKK